MNVRRIAALASKEWREILRDRMFLALAFLVPVAQMLIMGHGLSFDVEHIPFAVVDQDQTPTSREYTYRFADSRYFDFKGYSSLRDVEALISRGSVRAVLVIPERMHETLLAGRPVQVEAVIDGTFPYRTQTTKGYIAAIDAAFNQDLLADFIAARQGIPRDRAADLASPVGVQVRYLFNEAMRSIWGVAPAVIMLVLMIYPPMLTAVGVVREKESGAIDNIYSSTLTRTEFLIGKLLPYVCISWTNALILWGIACVHFGVPFKGSAPLFFAVSGLYVLCTTAFGFLVSLFVRTQLSAIIITMLVALVPTMLYSGMMVPVSSLSPAGQLQSRLLPATYFYRIAEGCFLKGAGAPVLWPDIAALIVYSVLLCLACRTVFTKRPAT